MIVHISPFNFETGLIDESQRLTNIISAQIERDATDETSLLESATVKLDTLAFDKGWYAVDAIFNNARNRLGVFYFTLENVEQKSDGSLLYQLGGVSTLYNASVERVKGGWSVVQGNRGTKVMNELLGCCAAPLDIEPFQVAKTQVYNGNVTKLGACWSILRACDMCLQIQEDGTIKVMSIPTEPIKTMSMSEGDLTSTITVSSGELSYECGLYGKPYDAVYVNFPRFGVDETLNIASQSIKLESSLIAEETVKEQVYDD